MHTVVNIQWQVWHMFPDGMTFSTQTSYLTRCGCRYGYRHTIFFASRPSRPPPRLPRVLDHHLGHQAPETSPRPPSTPTGQYRHTIIPFGEFAGNSSVLTPAAGTSHLIVFHRTARSRLHCRLACALNPSPPLNPSLSKPASHGGLT